MSNTETELKYTLQDGDDYEVLKWKCSLCDRIVTDVLWHTRFHGKISFIADTATLLRKRGNEQSSSSPDQGPARAP